MTVTPDRRSGQAALLGPAGPDEMGRELAEGPAAVEATLAEADRLSGELATLRANARRVVLLGTGASLAMARTAEPILRTATWVAQPASRATTRPATGANGTRPLVVAVREAAHAVLGAPDGESFVPGDLVVAISQSGESPETLAAARLARAAGARILAVTAASRSGLASAADLVFTTPTGPEGGAATKTELAALAALLVLAGALPADARSRAGLGATLAAIVASPQDAVPAGLALGHADRVWVVGFGPALGLAQAMGTLLHEKALLPAVAITPSELRHGPIEVATPGDVVLLVETGRPDPGRTGYLARLAGELRGIGTTLVVVGTMPTPPGAVGLPIGVGKDGTAAGAAATAGSTTADEGASGPAPGALLATLLRLQQAARVAAHARGTYRDGFRILRQVVRAADDLLTVPD